MSNYISLYPNSKFGYQVIFKSGNSTKKRYNIGLAADFPYELELKICDSCAGPGIPPMDSGTYKFTYMNDSIQARLPIEQMDIPDNTIVIRYSRELLNILTLKKSLDLKTILFYQFKEDLYTGIRSKEGILSDEFNATVHAVIDEIELGLPCSSIINQYIGQLSQLSDEYSPAIKQMAQKDPFGIKIEALMKFIITHKFQYPLPDEFKAVTGITKSAFQKAIKSKTDKTLKCYINELIFKSGMHAILFTHKSNTEIADEHGYSELSAFSRRIKDRAGCSPLNIRNIYKGDILNLMPQ